MDYLLAADIGNTNITTGLFANDKLLTRAKISTGSYSSYARELKSILKLISSRRRRLNASCDCDARVRLIISSVVPLATTRFLAETCKLLPGVSPVVLGRDAIVPIKNKYRNKGEVGQDRLVNAYAAKALYGVPAIIIDFGTAITFDIISAKGGYLGGIILPGIEMGLASLHRKTALLPKVDLREVRDIIGKTTASSMRGGILFGYGAMCDGLIAQYKKILGKSAKVIATGGNAGLIKKYTASIKIIDENLTLKGLRLIVKE
ncbi:MAG: type III pantothenate kinase [Candidatus Omnitrophota bacterium]